jgi:hypothetical protein
MNKSQILPTDYQVDSTITRPFKIKIRNHRPTSRYESAPDIEASSESAVHQKPMMARATATLEFVPPSNTQAPTK